MRPYRHPLHHVLRESALGLLGMLIAWGVGTGVIVIVIDTVKAMDDAGKREARVPCAQVMGPNASEEERRGMCGGFVGDDGDAGE